MLRFVAVPVALLEKRRYLNNRSGDFPQVILIVPSHVPNSRKRNTYYESRKDAVHHVKQTFDPVPLKLSQKLVIFKKKMYSFK
jgi:hypothetical protein